MSKISLTHLIHKDKCREKQQIALIEASPLFDKKWYLSQYPDVKKKKVNAAKHYLKKGYKEGRNPSPDFDGKDYLKRYKDVAKKGVNPLVHYILHGAKEGRSYNEITCPAKLLVQNNIAYKPKISIVIPVYNAAPYLDELLGSIASQTLNEIEIICVDDGSTDNSLEILKKYAQKDQRITIMQQNNMHAGIARNSGISVAKGEYIHFMDADDWLFDKDVYKKLYKIAEEQNFCDIIRFKGKAYDCATKEEIDNRLYERTNIDKKYEDSNVNIIEEPQIFSKLAVVPWLGIIKTDFAKKHNLKFNNLACCNDRSFFRLSCLTSKIIYLADLFAVKHRVNNASSLIGIRDRNFDCHFQSIGIISDFLRNKKIPTQVAKQVMVMELIDVMGFFRRYFYSSKYAYKIYVSTIKFMQNFNLEALEPYVCKIGAYPILVALKEKHGRISKLDYFIEKYFNKFAKRDRNLSSLLKFAFTYPIRVKEEYDRLNAEYEMLCKNK